MTWDIISSITEQLSIGQDSFQKCEIYSTLWRYRTYIACKKFILRRPGVCDTQKLLSLCICDDLFCLDYIFLSVHFREGIMKIQSDGKNMEFGKLPELPRGSEAFQCVLLEIEREKHPVEMSDSEVSADDISPRSRVNSTSSTKKSMSPASRRWFAARVRVTKPSMYKVVTLAQMKHQKR